MTNFCYDGLADALSKSTENDKREAATFAFIAIGIELNSISATLEKINLNLDVLTERNPGPTWEEMKK